MKKIPVFFLCSLLLGIVFVLLPWHMEFTGYVLLLLGMGGLVCRLLCKKEKHTLCRILAAAMALCTAALLGAMGFIGVYGAKAAPNPNADYAVVLGAQIHGDQPSRILRERLDCALSFMEENPDCVIIVSGGYGTVERHSEARVMYDYLKSQGADVSRVYMEDAARNTRENLLLSSKIAEDLGLKKENLNIISSRYHLCRSAYIAESLDFSAGTVGAKTETAFFYLNYLLREAFSFVKAFFQA